MDEELKKQLNALGVAFEEFKKANDLRLKAIAERGAADAETVARVEAINNDITAIRGAVDKIETAQRQQENLVARLELVGNPRASEAQERLRIEARQFLALTGQRLEISAEVAAEHLERYQNYRRAFSRYLRHPSDKQGFSLDPDIRAAMSGGTDPGGGYFLTPDLSGRLVELLYETTPIRQFANVETTSKREVTGRNDLNEAGGGWIGEVTAPTETTHPEVGEWKIPIQELYAEPRASQDELDDSEFDVEMWLLKKVADKLSRLENTASVSGNGIKQWRGFLTYAAGTPAATSAAAWAVIQQTGTGASGAFAAAPNGGDVFLDTIGTLKVPYRQNARWAMNRTTEAAARKLKDSDGAYHWQPGLQAGTPSMLCGYPLALFEDMPVLAANSLSIAFADWKQAYEIRDRKGVSTLRDPFTGKPFVKFYTTKRSGGAVVNFEAIKLIKFG